MEHDDDSSGDSGKNYEHGGEQRLLMVEFELEAAEALAGLAQHSSIPEDEFERPSKRLNHSSPSPPPHVSVTHHQTSHHLPKQDRTVEQPEKISNVLTKPVKDDNQLKQGLTLCSTSYMSVGGSKSRQPFTEIEKEARRLRRVLANRESARQTIRRRQAMFEELTRKAADLALQNENLKREKELAVEEYDSLKNTNDSLKKQIAKMVKPKAEKIQEVSKPTNAGCSPSACSLTSYLPFNQTSAMPLHWPPILQPLDATLSQCRSQSDFANPQVYPMTFSSSNQRESTIIANPGTFVYVLPFPCFFPLHSPTSALHPQSSDQILRQNENYLDNQCTTCSSKSILLGDDCRSSLPLKAKTETSNSTLSIPPDDPHQNGFEFPSDGGGKGGGTDPTRMILTPTPLSCVKPLASAGEGLYTTSQQDGTSNLETIASTSEHSENGVPEENQEPVVCSNEKPVNVATAAKARRRRKELMKLRNLRAS